MKKQESAFANIIKKLCCLFEDNALRLKVVSYGVMWS